MPRKTSVKKRAPDQSAGVSRTGAEVLDPVFRELVLQSPFSTWIADRNGTSIFQNAACRKLFGIDSDDQVIGKYNIFRDKELERQGFMPQVQRVFGEGIPLEGTLSYDLGDSGVVTVPHSVRRYIRGFLFPIKDASGNVQYVVVQHEDYTEKHETEEALQLFRHASESSDDSITMLDAQGKMIYVNPACAAMYGYAPDELVGKPASMLCYNPAETYDILSAVLQIGKWMGETVCVRKDGTTFIMEGRLSTISLPSREAPGILAICRDVTAEKQAEESKRRMEAHFEEQQRQFYKQTIRAATGGKLIICEPDEIALLDGKPIEEYDVHKPEDIGEARHGIKAAAVRLGMPEARAESLALCMGEAATNAFKHAGSGVVTLLTSGSRVMVRVSDHGPGMDTLTLPRATLELGYSTIGSLGMGYAVILALADQVSLSTGPTGTTVVIEMDAKSPVGRSPAEALPDTW